MVIENPFDGTWLVAKPTNLGSLEEIKIEQQDEDRFLVTAPGLHLPDLAYDAEEEILVGTCQGKARDVEGTFYVAIVKYGPPTALQCKGIVFFAAEKDRDDNSVGTWTADKKGPTGPPPHRS